MRIKAKFASFCGACKGPIAPGDDIEWSPGSKPQHVACPVPVERPVDGGRPEPTKTKFVRALERLAGAVPPPTPTPAPSQARASSRDHFVQTVCRHGARPARLDLPGEGYEEIVLTVGPKAQVMERALVRPGVEALYLRFNGGDLVDRAVNNVPGTQELGWRMAWSPVLQMAVEGIRLRAS